MLFLPQGALPPKMSGAGYARGHSSAGHWLRARASVVNPNSDAMSRWRQVFIAAKMNWQASQSGGANTAPINGITPAEAWFYLSVTYLGILLPGLFEGDIQLQQSMVGCSTVEAFEVMISTILAQLDMPTPIGPTMTTAKAAASGSTVSATAGTATLAVSPASNTQVGPITAIYEATLTISSFTMPTVPTPSGQTWSTSQTVMNQFAMLPNSIVQGNLLSPFPTLGSEVPGPYTNAVTGLPAGVTCALGSIPLPGSFWLASPMVYQFSVTAQPDAEPGTYQASFTTTGPGGTITYNFVVVILDPTAYTMALSFAGLPAGATADIQGFWNNITAATRPASLDSLPHGWNTTFGLTYNPSANTLTGSLAFGVTIDPSTTASTYTFGATLTGYSSAPSVSPQLTVTAVSQQVGQPCPPFQVGSLAAHTVYDGDWNIIGFSLSPTFKLSEFNDPSQLAGYSYACAWSITASPAYSSGYAVPLASTWRTILASGPFMPTPAQVLAAWENIFGTLPATGNMKIEVQWVDPLTGAPGPQTTHTMSWETGTNKGAAKPQQGWPLPDFAIVGYGATVIAPGSAEITFGLNAGNHYTGTITWDFAPSTYLNTGTPPGSDALPKGLTGTFSNLTMTFVDGVPDNASTTLTLTATAGAQAFNGKINVKISDSAVTQSNSVALSIVGDVVALPPYNYLQMSPTTTEIYTAASSITALLLELFNSSANDMPVSMLTTNTDPDYTIEFGQGGPAAASWSPTFSPTPGFASPAVPSSTTYGAQTITVPNGAVAIGPGTNLTIPITTSPGGLPVYYVGVTPSVAHVTYSVVPGFGGDITGVNIYVDVSAVPGTYTHSLQLMDQYDTHLGGPLTVELTISTPTGGETTFALATGDALDALVGQTLTRAGYAPAGYNGSDAAIISSTDTTVTISQPTDPGAMTTEGVAGIINNGLTVPAGTLTAPGTATVLAFIEVASAFTAPNPALQVVASAGKNTTYSIINTTSTAGNGFQMSPLITYVNQPVPGTSTVTLEFSNTNPAAITATLASVPPNGNGISVSVPASVTIPAAVGAVPGTTSVTATITATAEADTSEDWPAIQAIAGSYSQIVSIVFTDTQYGPLYINVAPAPIAPPRGTNQTITVTVYNESAQAATVTLSLPYTPTGFTLTLGSSTLSLAAGSTTAPATATTTLTVTVSGSAPPVMFPVAVNANATGYAETGFVFITLYTP